MWEIIFFISGYLVQTASSFLLIHKLRSTKSTYGLSPHTQILFLFSTLARVVWVGETRLMDTPITIVELITSVAAQFTILYYFWQYRHTSNVGKKEKNHSDVWWPLRWYYLALASGILATLFHPGRATLSMQILVAYSIYSEAMALLPQLATMRTCIEVESITSNYVAILVSSRLLRLLFWVNLYHMGETFPGLMVADLVHTLLSADFLRLWVQKLKNGGLLLYR